MRQSVESKEFVWKSADVTTMSRRAVAASVLAISCVVLGFIGGRLSTLIVPSTITTQVVARAPLPTPLPALVSQGPDSTLASTVAKSAADLPVATPNPTIAIINAGTDANLPQNPPSQGDQRMEEPRAGRVQALPVPEQRSVSRVEPADQDRARDYSDLRRQMLSR